MARYAIAAEIQQLDPVVDHERIVYLVGAYEFPFVIQRTLEIALFRTFASESIAALLVQTGQFAHHGQKRYDDTALLIAEIAEHGYDSEPGRAAIRRMNQLHHRYNISNEDYLYVLSTFVFEPIRWNHILAWRPSTENERLANFYFWREVGKRMNIRDIPATMEEFERFNMDYEQRHFRYNPASAQVGRDAIAVFTRWFPAVLHPLVRYTVYALLDEPLLKAFGFPQPPRWYRAFILRMLRMRAGLIRLMPPRRTPYTLSRYPTRTYPKGHQIDDLGA